MFYQLAIESIDLCARKCLFFFFRNIAIFYSCMISVVLLNSPIFMSPDIYMLCDGQEVVEVVL